MLFRPFKIYHFTPDIQALIIFFEIQNEIFLNMNKHSPYPTGHTDELLTVPRGPETMNATNSRVPMNWTMWYRSTSNPRRSTYSSFTTTAPLTPIWGISI